MDSLLHRVTHGASRRSRGSAWLCLALMLVSAVVCGGAAASGSSSTAASATSPTPPGRPDGLVVRGGQRFSLEPRGGVMLVHVDTRDGGRALLQLSDTGSELDGLALLSRMETRGGADYYLTELGGDEVALLQRRKEGVAEWFVALPDRGARLRATPRDAITPQEQQAVLARYARALADGSDAARRAYSRKGREAAIAGRLDVERQRALKVCTPFAVEIDWQSWSDDDARKLPIDRLCAAPIEVLRGLCAFQSAKTAFAQRLQKVRCRRGDALALAIADGVLTFSVHPEGKNREFFVRDALLDEAAWLGAGSTLRRQVDIERTTLCKDTKANFVGVMRRLGAESVLFYGTGDALVEVPQAPPPLPEAWFFEPREAKPGGIPNPHDADLTYYSSLDAPEKENTCALRCGTRVLPLQLVGPHEKQALLMRVSLSPAPPRRVPYALARDRKGTYYFVDRSADANAIDFALYRGPKGNLKKLDMLNVVSDSEGDVFSTPAGDLRLVLEKQSSFWVRKTQSEELINVPLVENWGLVYQELGVYAGVPLHTPCEAF